MIEILLFLGGVGAGVGLGFWLGFGKGLDQVRDDEDEDRKMFMLGAQAQKDLGFLVKRVPSDEPVSQETSVARTPRLRQDPRNSGKGSEYPGGREIPPMPNQFNPESGPTNFAERLKTIPDPGRP